MHRVLGLGSGLAHRPLPQWHPGRIKSRSGWLARSRDAERRQPRAHPGPPRHRWTRGQSLAQLAIAWALRDPRVTSVLIGASSVAQLEQNVAALDHLDFTADELPDIDRYAVEGDIDLWRGPATA